MSEAIRRSSADGRSFESSKARASFVRLGENLDDRIGGFNTEWISKATYDLPELLGPVSTVIGLTEILPDATGPKFLISKSNALL